MTEPIRFDKMEALIAKHRSGEGRGCYGTIRSGSAKMKRHALIKMFKNLDFNNLPENRKWAV